MFCVMLEHNLRRGRLGQFGFDRLSSFFEGLGELVRLFAAGLCHVGPTTAADHRCDFTDPEPVGYALA